MEFLSRTIKQIQDQLGLLTLSQRFAIFLCLVIMFGAIFWMVKYSSEQTMMPLLPMSFSEDEITRIKTQFGDWQQKYRIKGDQILVPSEDRQTLVSRLGYAELLPDDTSLGFLTLLGDNGSVFESEGQRAQRSMIILQMELAKSLKDFPGITKAEVFINPASNRRMMNMTPMASASVYLTLNTKGRDDSGLGNTVAGFVSSANKNMKRENVTVVADGKKLDVIAVGRQNPVSALEIKASLERYYQNKVISVLEVGNAIVQVDVTPQLDETEQVLVQIPEADKGSWLPTVEQSSSEQSSNDSQVGREPGIRENVGSEVAGGGGTNRTELNEQNDSMSMPFPGSDTTKTVKAVGGVKELTVTVSYPKSFFRHIAKIKSGDMNTEPSDAAVQAQIDAEIPGLRNRVSNAIGLPTGVPENESRVYIDTYWDLDPVILAGGSALAETQIAGSGAVGSLGSLARGYSKQIAVSALALMSLFMVLMMVKKASGPIELEDSEAEALMTPGKRPIDVMSPEDSNFAEAEDAGGLLAGMELDESTVQSQQMLEQIRSMVEDSPDKVAGLVSKWASQGD